MKKVILAGFVIWSLTFVMFNNVAAELLEANSEFGDGSITVDTDTRLGWLVLESSEIVRDQGEIFGTAGLIDLGTDVWSQSITAGITGKLYEIQIQFESPEEEGVIDANWTFSILSGSNPETWSTLFSQSFMINESDLVNDDGFTSAVFTWNVSDANLIFKNGDSFVFEIRCDVPGINIAANYLDDDLGYVGYDGGQLYKNDIPLPIEQNDMAFITYVYVLPSSLDYDGDVISDVEDNCPTVYNPDQTDENGNGIGDICESIPDDIVIGNNFVLGIGSEINVGVEIGDNVSFEEEVVINKNATVDNEVFIGSGTILNQGVVLGNGVAVGPDVTIGKDTIVSQGVKIGAGSVIGKDCTIGDDVVIGERVVIGRGVTVLAGTVIPEGTVIEKNSIVGGDIGEPIFDNFGPEPGYRTSSPLGFAVGPISEEMSNVVATIFSPSQTANLDSFEVPFWNSNGTEDTIISLYLVRDDEGKPGTDIIESYNLNLGAPLSLELYTVTSSTNPVLNAGENYWLMASSTEEVGWLYTSSNATDGLGYTWSYPSQPFYVVIPSTEGRQTALRVNGIP